MRSNYLAFSWPFLFSVHDIYIDYSVYSVPGLSWLCSLPPREKVRWLGRTTVTSISLTKWDFGRALEESGVVSYLRGANLSGADVAGRGRGTSSLLKLLGYFRMSVLRVAGRSLPEPNPISFSSRVRIKTDLIDQILPFFLRNRRYIRAINHKNYQS